MLKKAVLAFSNCMISQFQVLNKLNESFHSKCRCWYVMMFCNQLFSCMFILNSRSCNYFVVILMNELEHSSIVSPQNSHWPMYKAGRERKQISCVFTMLHTNMPRTRKHCVRMLNDEKYAINCIFYCTLYCGTIW
jgi:hypothetical protein